MNNNQLGRLTRLQLARLGREYMLFAQFNSRTGYAALQMNHGPEAYKPVAIENWMAVSPVYTQRMQQAMGFSGGDDVATIFKGLQLECGFSHQYFDVHFEVSASDKGRFWLKSCGPLLEMEPRGDEAVKTMCHDIEDPTFDATAVATNPRARMRPVHRPPRMPTNRSPHCEWLVVIDHDAEPLQEVEATKVMRTSQLASLSIERPQSTEPGGMENYSGDVFEQIQLEQFSHAALVVICKELAAQCHMLILSLMLIVEKLYGREAATTVALFQMTGSTRVMSERLCESFDKTDGSLQAIADVLSIHPAFQPSEYIGLELSFVAEDCLRIAFTESPAGDELNGAGWFSLITAGLCDGLESLVQGVNPQAQLSARGDMVWDIVIADTAAEEEPLAVQIAKGTVLYKTELEDHIPLLQAT